MADDEAWPHRDAYLEHYLHGACDDTPPLLAAGGHFFFEPGASLCLSTGAACVAVLARRLQTAWASQRDPRDEVNNPCREHE
jgi:hypothetical protein